MIIYGLHRGRYFTCASSITPLATLYSVSYVPFLVYLQNYSKHVGIYILPDYFWVEEKEQA